MGRYGEGGAAHLEDLEVEHGGLAQDLLAEQQRARLRLALLAALELLVRCGGVLGLGLAALELLVWG